MQSQPESCSAFQQSTAFPLQQHPRSPTSALKHPLRDPPCYFPKAVHQCTTLEAPLFLRALKKNPKTCWFRHFNSRKTGQGREIAWAPHKERLREVFHVGIFPPASHRKPAVTQQCPHHHSHPTAPSWTSLLPPWGGQGVPTAVSPPCRRVEQQPLCPHRVPVESLLFR